MAITLLKFKNEDNYRAARDINLAMLEAEGWKPKEDLEMVVIDTRAERLRAKLDEEGVDYVAVDDWTPSGD